MTYLEMIIEQEALQEYQRRISLLESKWNKLLRQGKLSAKDLARIKRYRTQADPLYVKQLLKDGKKKQAEEYLKKKGIVKSLRQWLAGMEKGSNEIIRKSGGKIQHKPDTAFAQLAGFEEEIGKTMKNPFMAHTTLKDGSKARVHVATGLSKKDQALQQIIKRHEADELRALKKDFKKHKSIIFTPPGNTPHASDEVIKAEKEHMRVARDLYKDKNVRSLDTHRTGTGEYTVTPATKKQEYLKRKELFTNINKELKALERYKPADRRKELDKWLENHKEIMSKKDFKRFQGVYYDKLRHLEKSWEKADAAKKAKSQALRYMKRLTQKAKNKIKKIKSSRKMNNRK